MKVRDSILPLLLAAPFCSVHADTGTTPGIETLTVTAHRLPSESSVLPVITRDVSTQPAVGLDALRDLPGFAINQSGALGTLTQVRVRGSEANHLLVLVDGVEVTDPSTDGGFNFGNLNLAGIERIEYLPGAQSAIWGSQALSGVLHLTTRPSDRVRRLTLEGGSFDTRQIVAQLADANDSHYYNLSVADFETDGTNIARSGSEDDGHRNRSASLSGGLDRERWSVRGLVRHTATRSDYDPTPFPTYLPTDGDRENRHRGTLAMTGLTVRSADERVEEQLTLSWLETQNDNHSDGIRDARAEGKRWKLNSVTRFTLTERQQLDLLLEHQQEWFRQRALDVSFGDPNQSQKVRSASAGLEYRIDPTDRWALSASTRFDRNSEFDDATSYRLAASYLWSDATRLWAAAGTGIKNPGFTERFGYIPTDFIGNADLEPETNEHVSLGIQQRIGEWDLALTLFNDRLKDEIDGFFFDPVLGGMTSRNRDGTSRRRGAELETGRGWTSGNLRVGASYVHAREPDDSREIRRPRWLGFARLTQELPLSRLSIDVFHTDEQLDQDFATFPADIVTLDAYTLVNAALAVPVGEQLTVTLRGSNLLDESYEDQLGYRSPGRAWYLNLAVDF